MPTTTAAVSRFFSEFQLKDAPTEVRHEAKRILLDTWVVSPVGGPAKSRRRPTD